MVALAGVPGCGKSTLSAALAELYEERTTKPLRIVAMVSQIYSLRLFECDLSQLNLT